MKRVYSQKEWAFYFLAITTYTLHLRTKKVGFDLRRGLQNS
jgi:hypothetical protein